MIRAQRDDARSAGRWVDSACGMVLRVMVGSPWRRRPQNRAAGIRGRGSSPIPPRCGVSVAAPESRDIAATGRQNGRMRALLPYSVAVVALAGAAWSLASFPWEPSGRRRAPIEFRNLDLHRQLLAAKRARYAAADGGGRVDLVEQPDAIRAAESGEFVIRYEAGPLGVAEGGRIDFQVSPFWGWSEPQVEVPESPGYTVVTTDAASARLRAEAIPGGALSLHVEGGPLAPGEAVWIRYGAGGTARVDRYADDEEAFFVWVDGDGRGAATAATATSGVGEDGGSRRLVPSDVRLRVGPREAQRLLVTAPSVAAIDERFELAVAALDAAGNRVEDFLGDVELLTDAAMEAPAVVTFSPEHRGARRIEATIREEGVFFAAARVGGLVGRSNPIKATPRPRRMIWADLQIHSSLSDGTGSPEALYAYARDVARLDVAAVTDHDHHGMRKLDERPDLWERMKAAVADVQEPGRFVSLLGYEWTSWVYGHRHVLFFDDDGEVFSNLEPPTDTPQGLWAALRAGGHDAMTVPHHPAGGAQALDWSIAPDPWFEPNVEIVSVHGSSEELGGPLTIRGPIEGHFVRDALAKGYRLGFLGSTDGHDGHPGLAHLAGACGGLTAILTDDLTREGVRDALRARRTYATSGPRIYIEFSLGANGMGSVVPRPTRGEPPLHYRASVIGTAPLESLELIKNGAVWARWAASEEIEQATVIEPDEARRARDCVYLRVVQADGHVAYTSPIWTE